MGRRTGAGARRLWPAGVRHGHRCVGRTRSARGGRRDRHGGGVRHAHRPVRCHRHLGCRRPQRRPDAFRRSERGRWRAWPQRPLHRRGHAVSGAPRHLRRQQAHQSRQDLRHADGGGHAHQQRRDAVAVPRRRAQHLPRHRRPSDGGAVRATDVLAARHLLRRNSRRREVLHRERRQDDAVRDVPQQRLRPRDSRRRTGSGGGNGHRDRPDGGAQDHRQRVHRLRDSGCATPAATS